MNNIEDLIVKIQVAQVASEGYAKELSDIKEKKEEIDQLIEENKAELLKLITSDEAIKVDNLVAQRFHRENTGYTDEKKLIEFLKSNCDGKFIKTKVTESLDKNPLKKELKGNPEFKTLLSDFISEGFTDYVVVTTEDNYEKMFEHINEGK